MKLLLTKLPGRQAGPLKNLYRVMKLTWLLVLTLCLQTSASVWSQTSSLSLKLNNTTLQELFNTIENKTGYRFFYNNDEVDVSQKVTLSINDKTVGDILTQAFKDLPYSFKELDNKLILIERTENKSENTGLQQQKTINGKVNDPKGLPLPGVTVLVKGTTNGTVSGADGNYSLGNVPLNTTLVFSFVGMKTQEVAVGNQISINVTMEEETVGIEEVVAIGYGTVQRSSVVGSSARINTEEIEGFPSVNVVDAMQGRAAGVYVLPSRQPGEDPKILIRGSRSLKASNNPLLIIDGMPGSWDNINSEDIAAMEVLKDAAATAIYGSRAANGVILITTKSAGKETNRFTLELNSYAGVNHYNFIPMQPAEKYAALIRDVMRYQTHGATNVEAWKNSDIDTKKGLEMFNTLWATNYYDKNINYDWQNALFNKTSFSSGNNISISNRTKNLAYRLSYNFQNDNSYYKTVNFQRHTLNSNVNMKITSWLDFEMITRLSLRENTGWPDNMWDNMRRMSPFETPYIDENPSKGLKETVGKEKYINALWNYEEGYLIDDRGGKMGDIILKTDIKPYDWLTLTTNLKLDFYEFKHGIYRDSKTSYQNLGYNYAEMEKNAGTGYTWNAIANVNKTISDDHKILLTTVIEAIQDKREGIGASAQDIPAQYMDYHFLQTGILNRNIWSDYSKSSLLSYMARGQYEHKGKYLVNFAVRADGSSRLAEENRWRTFPSVAIAWRLSEEQFMVDNNIFSNLKLRLSYGEIGNQAIDPYQTMTRLKYSTYSWDKTGIYTWQPDGLANKSLGWEVSKTWNFGVDFGLSNRKLDGSVEYYHTNNVDLLMQRQLPETTGFGNIWQNIGKTLNEGIEVSLSVYPINKKDFTWSVTGLFSRNWNKITELLDGKDDRANRWFIGQPISVIWDYKKNGIWQIDEAAEAKKFKMEPGMIKVVNRDDDTAFTDADRFILGQREPKIISSLQSIFRYKKLDCSFNIVGQFGHLIQAENYTAEWNADKYIIDAIDWWTPLNPTNKWPRAHTAQSHSFSSTLSIFKGDFIKIQDISLGYVINKKLLENKVNNLRVYIQARNPLYLHKACPRDVNPEQPNTMYTLPTSYVLGINLSI